MSEPATSPAARESDPMVRRVMKRAAILGVLVVLVSLYWRSLPVTLGALAGVALALINFEVHRRLVGSMISQGRSGAAAGMFVLKLGVLLGVLYALVAVLGLDAIALMAGFSVLVVAISTSGNASGGDAPGHEDGNAV